MEYTDWEADVVLGRHASQNGRVDVVGAVGGAHDEDLAALFRHEAVPKRHELRLDEDRRLVVLSTARSEERVCNIQNTRCRRVTRRNLALIDHQIPISSMKIITGCSFIA